MGVAVGGVLVWMRLRRATRYKEMKGDAVARGEGRSMSMLMSA